MYYILYKTTNLINGKQYIGIHRSKYIMDAYLGSSPELKSDVRKYGRRAFKRENLEILPNQQAMIDREKIAITEDMLASDNWYNKEPGGCYVGTKHADSDGFRSYRKNFMKDMWKSGKMDFLHKDVLSVKNPNLRRRWYYCGDQERKFAVNEYVPEGWIKGRHNLHSAASKQKLSSWMWITNGIINDRIKLSDEIPADWVRGRTLHVSGQNNPNYGKPPRNKGKHWDRERSCYG